MVSGYKCFDPKMINRYGQKFEVGKTYFTDSNDIKFGMNGKGFHFCKNLEDALRYFDTTKEVAICKVWGFGKIESYEDDMYVAEKIFIEAELSQEEIIEYALNLDDISVIRFIMSYPLTTEEIELFKDKFQNFTPVLDAIKYYQEKDLDVYERKIRL